MTSALILSADSAAADSYQSELEAAGIHVLGATARHTLVREVARLAPDLVIGWDDHPDPALRGELSDLKNRYQERTLVDRAKGILMRAGRHSEEEAFRLLRSVSQRDQRRVGQVARR